MCFAVEISVACYLAIEPLTGAKMVYYALIEVDDGYTVVQFANEESAEEAAVREGSILVDPGPYLNYEEAYEALDRLEVFDEEVDIV
jgi:hypothetical protein